ncbi:MAG: nuclear transport factor 2 family protein, partial [Planctomycetota bacterium]|nr:nuclear transport factor 2 family protein [Planctomycetota bacterium]
YVLDQLHDAASKADGERYFNLFAPDAVFLGTDATERWSIEQFKAYAKPHFEAGTGWTYYMSKRHIFIDDDASTAWFDEVLHNAQYGASRGTGVLVKLEGDWKIAQYNLMFPIPNDIAKDVIKLIKEHDAKMP